MFERYDSIERIRKRETIVVQLTHSTISKNRKVDVESTRKVLSGMLHEENGKSTINTRNINCLPFSHESHFIIRVIIANNDLDWREIAKRINFIASISNLPKRKCT